VTAGFRGRAEPRASESDPRASAPEPLSTAQEAALVRELFATLKHLARTYFKDALKPAQLSLRDAEGFLGRYVHDTRSIELSRTFVHSAPWGSVVEVLKHELAHQFVLEVLREQEAPHGPAFRAVCARLGIDARSSGVPEPSQSPESQRVLERVHKLLALAESDNRHEAEAAAAAAQRLMLRHNLESSARPADQHYGYRHLGRITGRVSEWERRLGNLLSEHFFVEVIWVPAYRRTEQRRGSVLEAIGSAENLEIAAYVYDFLVRSAEHLWRVHKAERGIREDRERMSYFAGVMSGFAQKLATQARAHKADGLVWLPQAELSTYTRKRHPYLRTVSHAGARRGDAFTHGEQAGRSVLLHRGMKSSGSGETRLLKS
jgi:predicted SprT family Zn-dependent metalloprotease